MKLDFIFSYPFILFPLRFVAVVTPVRQHVMFERWLFAGQQGEKRCEGRILLLLKREIKVAHSQMYITHLREVACSSLKWDKNEPPKIKRKVCKWGCETRCQTWKQSTDSVSWLCKPLHLDVRCKQWQVQCCEAAQILVTYEQKEVSYI